MAIVDVIDRQKLETRNRISLIVIDSTFEIALKEFVVHRRDLFPVGTDVKHLFERRPRVVAAVAGKVDIPQTLLDKAQHYYELRNKMIHERATVNVTDSDVRNYRETVERILASLFGLTFDV